ncbi:MAG TPA: hypothetical protein VJ599_04355 [Nitrososphaeraceae archaeon]|nr:hypothetical protein [Nitrososphaeraceae archaeon]
MIKFQKSEVLFKKSIPNVNSPLSKALFILNHHTLIDSMNVEQTLQKKIEQSKRALSGPMMIPYIDDTMQRD